MLARSDRMSEHQTIQSQPSRWDALGPSSSSARRRTHAASNKGKSNTSYGGHNLSKGRGKQCAAHNLRPCNSAAGNWRRRAADDVRNISSETTVEEEQVRAAMKNLQVAVTSFPDKNQGESGEESSDKVQGCVRHSIEKMASSLFDVSYPTNFLDLSCSHENHSTKLLPNISNDVLWDAVCSLLRIVQLLSQSSKNKCCQFMLSIASVAFACLQPLIHNQQHLPKVQSTRTKAMTDLVLCECASILLDMLGCGRCSVFASDVMETDEMLCKSTLFSCLAKILAISKMDYHMSPSDPKNTRERQGPLFPWGAEKTVNLIVKQTTLPFIELLTKGDGTATPVSEKLDYCSGAMECLFLLLQDSNRDLSFETADQNLKSNRHLSKHAAAILAPLVVDVLPDGKENQRVNPLRSRTLSIISAFWEWSYEVVQNGKQSPIDSIDQSMNVVMPCQCMAAALNAVRVVRQGKPQNNQNANTSEIDVRTLSRQLQSMIKNEELPRCRLKLLNLLTLCLAYQSVSASQWHLFLEKSGVKVSPLLSILEEGASAITCENYEDKSWATLPSALLATSTLLSAMPFTLWFSRGTRPTMRVSGGNFLSRVRNGLLSVLNCTLNLMTAIKGRISCGWLSKTTSFHAQSTVILMMQVSRVAGKLCTILSLSGENSAASRLLQCAGDIYVNWARLIVSKPSITELELRHTLLYKGVSHFKNFITESLEADLFDTVKVTTCSAPAEKWLSDASSYDFIGLLLTDSYWKFPSSKDRIEMLSSVAKRSPWTLAREPFNLASFCDVCVVQCRSQNDVDSRILGLKLIESFVLGRKNLLADSISNITIFSVVLKTFCPLLLAGLEDNLAAVRACAVSSFGSFLKRDWVDLFLSHADSGKGQCSVDWTPLECILSLCSAKDETNANVRSSSCKAIGDICTSCITLSEKGDDNNENLSFSDDFVLSFTCKISEVMINALTDKRASVRSMALHAIGNTALALKARGNEISAPQFPAMKHLFPSVCACLGDKDEKVVTNAIRSISHISYFVYRPEYVSELENNTSAALDIYKSLVLGLSEKINFTLEDAVGDRPRELTWKQRNGAKKHAWGSCTTLGIMLSFSNLLSSIDVSLAVTALTSLFRCIQLSNVINEKIVAAAIKALAKLPITLWHHLSCKCDSTGRGLATCFGFLHQKRELMTLHRDDVESLVNLLLTSAKRTDFCNLFLIHESVPFSVEYFYQWLVTHDIEAGVFEEISAAVSTQKIEQILDVSVVQMFLSRTIQQNRRQGSPCKVNVSSLPLVWNDEEGDEL